MLKFGLHLDRPFAIALYLVLLPILAAPLPTIAQDWVGAVRRLAADRKFSDARAVVEARLAANAADMEALGWRGRVNAWAGNWPDAERDYRQVLRAVPNEAEIMLALADVLAWQNRPAEALEYSDRAALLLKDTTLAPDAAIHRARNLRSLGRAEEARAAFAEAARLDPANREARNALAGVAGPLRHELRVGLDYDTFSFTGDAQAYTVSLRSNLSSRWTSNASLTFFNRFGEKPVRAAGSATYKATARDAFTFGAAAAQHRGIIARNEAFFDYNRGIRISETAPIRGLELNYAQRWLWFRDARILTLTPAAILYLPRDWTFTVQTTAARSQFNGTLAQWRPSGLLRLAFPVHPQVTVNSFFAVGTENFARVDQVGRFSARTWGGGGKWQFAPRQDVSFYAFYQDRSQGRSQTSFGMSYGFRF